MENNTQDNQIQQTPDYNLLKTLPVPVYICDVNGVITFCNTAAEKLWGSVPDLQYPVWDYPRRLYNQDGKTLSPQEHPMYITLKEKADRGPKEIIAERNDGSRISIIVHPKPLFDKNGNLTGGINVLLDITDKKKDEAQQHILSELLDRKVEERTRNLKESEERYHKMIDEVQDYAIILLDLEGYIINWNRGAQQIKGYSEQEIIGKNFRIFYQEEDRSNKLPEKLIREAFINGRASHEGWRLRKDGTTFWGSIVITALHDENGNTIGFSKVTRDLTEKKIADDQLRHYAQDIEFRNKQLEEYAYIASHDLQEPLRKIQIFTELLGSNINNEELAKKNLDKINMAAKRMSALIKDVLKYSQLSMTDEVFIPVKLNEILKTVKEDFELLIAEKNVTITNNELPVIKAIPIQIHQLFSNLISNSIKFSNSNPIIEITAQKLTKSETAAYPELNLSKKYVRITFKDNGLGFEQQYADQIFKMFKRLGSTYTGTGIGLALCKKITDIHNGHISVTSSPGTGTVFVICLPFDVTLPSQ